jgi:ubiquinone/menaquinone biosynthesis C-methylase UbiE
MMPERAVWAVETMNVSPSDRLLEIGCGRGSAVSLICEKLTDGKIIAIDRSLAMVRLAEYRNAAHVAAGKAGFMATALDAVDLADEQFDKVFSVNVNLFWVASASPELNLVRRVLKHGGVLYLFYEPPTLSKAKAIKERVIAFLGERGFAATTLTATTRRRTALLGIVARPAA